MDLDTFVTTVYVMVDDYCKAQEVRWPKTPGRAASLPVSEVLSLVLLSRWSRFGSDRAFYRFADRHLRAAFPGLPDYSQFNRLMRASGKWLIGFSQSILASLRVQACVYEALDTMGCATRNAKRRGEGWLAGEANIGYSNRLGWYEGLNVMTRVTPDGFITGFGSARLALQNSPMPKPFWRFGRLVRSSCQKSDRLPGEPTSPTMAFAARPIINAGSGLMQLRLSARPNAAIRILGPKPCVAGWPACDRSLKLCMRNFCSPFGWSASALTTYKAFAPIWPLALPCTISVYASIFNSDDLSLPSQISSIGDMSFHNKR